MSSFRTPTMDSSEGEAPSPRTGAASGAARGALVVATWTLALEAFLAASWRHLGDPFHFVGLALFTRHLFPGGPAVILPALTLTAALVGALLGAIATRLRRWRRLALLAGAAPALWVLVFLAMLAAEPREIGGALRQLVHDPLAVLGQVTFATAVVALPAALPAVMSILVIEGWTRPLNAPGTGLAHPAVRRWMFGALAVWTVALAAYAAVG